MIDERFAYITDSNGNRHQVLKYGYDDDGNVVPVDWDEQKTGELVLAAVGNGNAKA